MSTVTDDNTKHLDPLTTAANAAWLEYAKGTWSETDRRIFLAGFNYRTSHLTEDYYTLAEIRLAADTSIAEYGSQGQRLRTIADLIDRKRPELKPQPLNSDDCCHFQD